MSDDWSLKDFGIETWQSESPGKPHWKTYHEKDIETLRKKLIEDLKAKVRTDDKHLISTGSYNIALGDCIKIINKRFGVD